MSDDAPSKASKAGASGVSTATTTATPAPSGHALRRSFTVDESRRRSPLGQISSEHSSFPEPLRRRSSSNFTDYSLGDARDLLNPKVKDRRDVSPPESSSLGVAALTCALLPPVAGLFFKNGSALATDLLLLGVAGIFLHWSVTQPW